MVKYVSYYDCSGWITTVEIMNIQDYDAHYRITVFDRNGKQLWQNDDKLERHETKRVNICDSIKNLGENREGLIIVESTEQDRALEFPSFLTICGEDQDGRVGNRFVPFIRIP